MKNNIFGYMFILFIIIIMAFAIYMVKIQGNEKNSGLWGYIWCFAKKKKKKKNLCLCYSRNKSKG